MADSVAEVIRLFERFFPGAEFTVRPPGSPIPEDDVPAVALPFPTRGRRKPTPTVPNPTCRMCGAPLKSRSRRWACSVLCGEDWELYQRALMRAV